MQMNNELTITLESVSLSLGLFIIIIIMFCFLQLIIISLIGFLLRCTYLAISGRFLYSLHTQSQVYLSIFYLLFRSSSTLVSSLVFGSSYLKCATGTQSDVRVRWRTGRGSECESAIVSSFSIVFLFFKVRFRVRNSRFE